MVDFLIKCKSKKIDSLPIELEVSYQIKRLVYKLEFSDIISLNKACELLGITHQEYEKKLYYLKNSSNII